ncbi:hypothetical protein [Acidovorax sp. RAC01]|uniref:hypothetical protein n=1 Tax=Acidovorax sp. RAC01 TaxID=1842533 RepID=UPI0008574570|nr:hypothetical protein [Acidovorax sp. RAC01]AOG23612.1 putative lipoprotein [Acidovorax sp. RAC01]
MNDERASITAALTVKVVLSACLVVCGTVVSPLTIAKPASEHSKSANSKRAAAKPASAKIKVHKSSSEETSAERSRRLYRECKGMNNAGACKGYTGK